MRDILVISEKADLIYKTAKLLLDAGYQTKESQSSASAYEISADLIIFDATSFDDAVVFFTQIKAHYPLIPTIVLVEQGDVKTAVQVMRAGAFSVLTLPLNNQELLRDIQDANAACNDLRHREAVIQQAIDLLQSLNMNLQGLNIAGSSHQSRKISNNEDHSLELGDLIIHTKQRKAAYRGITVELTPTQYSLLAYLGEARGRIVSFEELYFHLHETRLDRSAARTALSSHMSYLRSKLEEVGCEDYLINIRGRGYLLDVPEQFTGR